jgi:hypothetical protein
LSSERGQTKIRVIMVDRNGLDNYVTKS